MNKQLAKLFLLLLASPVYLHAQLINLSAACRGTCLSGYMTMKPSAGYTLLTLLDNPKSKCKRLHSETYHRVIETLHRLIIANRKAI